jgi:hypothetical protein
MEIKEFNDKVITQFTDEITDLIFLYIQNDEKLMSKYLDLISEKNRQTVNAQLGKSIKEKFGVDNVIDEKGNTKRKEAKSILIKTKYTQHLR